MKGGGVVKIFKVTLVEAAQTRLEKFQYSLGFVVLRFLTLATTRTNQLGLTGFCSELLKKHSFKLKN
jgi:hypothetical protein